MVHAPHLLRACRWRAAVRCRVHRALLHPLLHLAAPVLLRLRLLARRASDPNHYLRGDHDCHVLLSALFRGLSLVVARIPNLRLLWRLSFHLLDSVHVHQDDHVTWRLHNALHWIHAYRFLLFLHPHWHRRLLCGMVLCALHLRGCQGRIERRNTPAAWWLDVCATASSRIIQISRSSEAASRCVHAWGRNRHIVETLRYCIWRELPTAIAKVTQGRFVKKREGISYSESISKGLAM
mmetsp:Transcript_18095/g.36463  ORF Transcript_18095/g.36463 Transcript_18095/m.36463 type:complete len:237 (-) Transcript_18095:22-732(-)